MSYSGGEQASWTMRRNRALSAEEERENFSIAL